MSPTPAKNRLAGRRRCEVKAIFLDRDGVINKDPGGWTRYNYVTDWREFQFLRGSRDALKIFKDSNIKVIVISNQAGVSKGYFSKENLAEVNRKMLEEVEKSGGKIEESFYCTHKDEDKCDCRKPKAGLLLKVAKKYHIDLKSTYFVGDSEADIIAGKSAGCKTIFVLSGKTSQKELESWDARADYVFNDLLETAEWLISKRVYKAG